MTIQRTFHLVHGSLLVFALALAILGGLLFINQRRFEASEENRFRLFALAEELRQSSEDLTRFARAYVGQSFGRDPGARVCGQSVGPNADGRAREKSRKHFERDWAVVPEVPGEKHGRHPSATELPLGSVAVGKRDLQLYVGLGDHKGSAAARAASVLERNLPKDRVTGDGGRGAGPSRQSIQAAMVG